MTVRTLLRLGSAAIAAVAALTIAVPVAQAAPSLTVTAPGGSLPVAVPPANGSDYTDFPVTVATDVAATNVTVSASGDGIVPFGTEHLATLTGSTGVVLLLAGSTPGLHTVTITVTADGAAPATTTRTNVWVPGGTLPSGGDLTGRSYGYQGYRNGDAESSVRDTEMLTFVSPAYAYNGLPPRGRPTCHQPTAHCRPYYYDPATGLVQIGDEIIGQVLGAGLYTDGFVPADTQDGELYTAYTAQNPLVFPKAHTKVKGHYRFSSNDYPSGLVYEDVTFRPDGSYVLSWRYDRGRTKHFSGAYAITGHGKVSFRSKSRLVQVGTVALVSDTAGTPKPTKLGLWLVLGGLKGKTGDGNLLEHVR